MKTSVATSDATLTAKTGKMRQRARPTIIRLQAQNKVTKTSPKGKKKFVQRNSKDAVKFPAASSIRAGERKFRSRFLKRRRKSCKPTPSLSNDDYLQENGSEDETDLVMLTILDDSTTKQNWSVSGSTGRHTSEDSVILDKSVSTVNDSVEVIDEVVIISDGEDDSSTTLKPITKGQDVSENKKRDVTIVCDRNFGTIQCTVPGNTSTSARYARTPKSKFPNSDLVSTSGVRFPDPSKSGLNTQVGHCGNVQSRPTRTSKLRACRVQSKISQVPKRRKVWCTGKSVRDCQNHQCNIHRSSGFSPVGNNVNELDLYITSVKFGNSATTTCPNVVPASSVGKPNTGLVPHVQNKENHILSCPPKLNSNHLRPIVVDGSNVAFSHGRSSGGKFSCKGIELCVKYFQDRGHKVTVFVPQYRLSKSREVTDQHILERLGKKQIVVFTPSRKVDGVLINSYDDRFILDLAAITGGVIVSNDNYRDIKDEKPEWRVAVNERLLMYVFVGDHFMVPDDPLGQRGAGLKTFLSFPK